MTVPILVIDDDPTFLEAVRSSLALVGPRFGVHVATSGREALALLRDAGTRLPWPAFLVVDYHLGDRDAPSLLRDIRALRELRDVPVLILTQFAWDRDVTAARQAGAAQFSVKPSRVRDLGRLLVEFWEEHADGRKRPVDGR